MAEREVVYRLKVIADPSGKNVMRDFGRMLGGTAAVDQV